MSRLQPQDITSPTSCIKLALDARAPPMTPSSTAAIRDGRRAGGTPRAPSGAYERRGPLRRGALPLSLEL